MCDRAINCSSVKLNAYLLKLPVSFYYHLEERFDGSTSLPVFQPPCILSLPNVSGSWHMLYKLSYMDVAKPWAFERWPDLMGYIDTFWERYDNINWIKKAPLNCKGVFKIVFFRSMRLNHFITYVLTIWLNPLCMYLWIWTLFCRETCFSVHWLMKIISLSVLP